MAWHRPGDKPLSEPMMVSLLTHECVTRPKWVKQTQVCAITTESVSWMLVSVTYFTKHVYQNLTKTPLNFNCSLVKLEVSSVVKYGTGALVFLDLYFSTSNLTISLRISWSMIMNLDGKQKSNERTCLFGITIDKYISCYVHGGTWCIIDDGIGETDGAQGIVMVLWCSSQSRWEKLSLKNLQFTYLMNGCHYWLHQKFLL